jgi:hypothetical protein
MNLGKVKRLPKAAGKVHFSRIGGLAVRSEADYVVLAGGAIVLAPEDKAAALAAARELYGQAYRWCPRWADWIPICGNP